MAAKNDIRPLGLVMIGGTHDVGIKKWKTWGYGWKGQCKANLLFLQAIEVGMFSIIILCNSHFVGVNVGANDIEKRFLKIF